MSVPTLVDVRGVPSIALPSVGYDIGLTFAGTGRSYSAAPQWAMMKNEITKRFADRSVALIDNTTAVNAMWLLRYGLAPSGLSFGGEPTAALLPDLMTFVFGITHFDNLLVISHRNRGPHYEKLLWQLIEMSEGALQQFNIDLDPADSDVGHNLERMFANIQMDFFDRPDLFSRWREAWSRLMGAEVAEPFAFTVDCGLENNRRYRALHSNMMGLLRTPKHPLQTDNSLGTPQLPQLPGTSNRYHGHSDFTDAECRAVYASYHTYRSIFYHAFADYFGIPYLPCSVRQVATHVLPILENLRPAQAASQSLLAQVDKYRAKKELRFAVPAIQISPTLAVFFEHAVKAKGRLLIKNEHWALALKAVRADSEQYRAIVTRLLQAFNAGDLKFIDKVVSELGAPGVEAGDTGNSLVTAAIAVGSGDYPAVAKEAWTLLTQKPWETIARLATRWHLSFILGARDAAERSLSLEAQAEAIWGRRFSLTERSYLQGLAKLHSSRQSASS